mmetsp:Transcript_33508/g.105882  ORF Transcript_33508/g.105882 Transcript_33508/m.105882 type:complete len:200 (-) Transcript_33508:765-1364(-)
MFHRWSLYNFLEMALLTISITSHFLGGVMLCPHSFLSFFEDNHTCSSYKHTFFKPERCSMWGCLRLPNAPIAPHSCPRFLRSPPGRGYAWRVALLAPYTSRRVRSLAKAPLVLKRAKLSRSRSLTTSSSDSSNMSTAHRSLSSFSWMVTRCESGMFTSWSDPCFVKFSTMSAAAACIFSGCPSSSANLAVSLYSLTLST